MCLAAQHVARCQLFPSWLYNWLGAVALSRCSASPASAWWRAARLGPTLGIWLCTTHCSIPTSLNWDTVSWGLCWLFVSDKSPRSLTYEEKRLFWLTVWKSPDYDLFCLLHCFWVARRRHIMVGCAPELIWLHYNLGNKEKERKGQDLSGSFLIIRHGLASLDSNTVEVTFCPQCISPGTWCL